ncbi:MAG: hypothetical protein JNJ71_10720 [Rubrivivax sp.]|nr:hypothetical protein [Rubrivivax sp.]
MQTLHESSHGPVAAARQQAVQDPYERARAEAPLLRQAAIDDFWRDADAAIGDAATRALRSATRWAARLRRHRLLRMG